ncbi:unnamed protein product [Trifolium pratense]|uniref:Uncharacterized protein n=2 Tax=Trifolium pratense TaxID=57577 RepID=A0ACB0IMF1_TRIPR|nr:unnamed protein product [Trifolium pratense]CAJ2647982.1 unnamed protein product [Trifolium pratense]
MSSSSVANSMAVEIPECGCKNPMRLYISNSGENPKRRYWKCRTHGGARSCNLFIWDDEIEGHPPYVRPTARPNVRESQTQPSRGCTCSELFKDVVSIVKEIQFNKGEKMKMKLQNERSTAKMFRNLLICSWIIFFFYVKMFT